MLIQIRQDSIKEITNKYGICISNTLFICIILGMSRAVAASITFAIRTICGSTDVTEPQLSLTQPIWQKHKYRSRQIAQMRHKGFFDTFVTTQNPYSSCGGSI